MRHLVLSLAWIWFKKWNQKKAMQEGRVTDKADGGFIQRSVRISL
jgi:hypothetical protein